MRLHQIAICVSYKLGHKASYRTAKQLMFEVGSERKS